MKRIAMLGLLIVGCSGSTEPGDLPAPRDGGARDSGPTRDGGAYEDPCGCGMFHRCEAGACVPRDAVAVQLSSTFGGPMDLYTAMTVGARVVDPNARDDRPVIAEEAGCVVYGNGMAENVHEFSCVDHGDLELEVEGEITVVRYSCSGQFPGTLMSRVDLALPGERVAVRAAGGADVDAFETFGFMPANPDVSAPTNLVSGETFAVTWTAAGGTANVEINVSVGADEIDCVVPDTGAFEIPASITSAVTAGRTEFFLFSRRVTTDKRLVGDFMVTTVQSQVVIRQ